MTKFTTIDLPTLSRATIGFDYLFQEMERQTAGRGSSTYPPYNIVQLSEDEYMISLAVAGFSMDDLDITKNSNILSIEGNSVNRDDHIQYLHKGIGGRNFTREFTLADHVEVEGASLDLGILSINLRRVIPEEMQPKKIAINTPSINHSK